MKWLARFEDMIAELESHPEIGVVRAELARPATDAEIERASSHVPYDLPPSVVAFYREMNGAMIRWRHRDQKWARFGARGTIGLLDICSVFRPEWAGADCGHKSWLPFDWYDGEYYAGFDPEAPDAIWYVDDTGDEGREMEADFETYLEAVLETRGYASWQPRDYASWQDMFLYDAEHPRPGADTKSEGRMQAILPLLFDNFDIDKVGNASHLAPADVSSLTPGPDIIVFQLADLNAELNSLIPEDSAIRDCQFWLTDESRDLDSIFEELPEPEIEHVDKGLEVLERVARSASRSFDLTDILRPDLVPVGGRRSLGIIDSGFHSGDADRVRDWFEDRGFSLVSINRVSDLSELLKHTS